MNKNIFTLIILRRLITAATVIILSLAGLTAYADENTEEEIKYYPAIGELDEDHADEIIADLEADGYIIYRRRHELILVLVPAAEVEKTADSDTQSAGRFRLKNKMRDRVRLEPGRKISPALDKARDWAGIDEIHKGAILQTPFDGSGIIVGFCDTGIDTNHPTFLDAEGRSRIRRFTVYNEYQGLRNDYSTPEAIAYASTDNADNYHGTHVGGIAAGRGHTSPYRGVAYNADIACSGSRTTDVGLLAGAEDIIEYAKSVGKPCVVNMSMASYNGPHDGTSLICRYLDYLADDAIIVISSGNEGATTHTLSHTFTRQQPEIRVRLSNSDWTNYHMYGLTDIWNDTDDPVKYRFFLYSDIGDRLEFPEIDFSETDYWAISSDPSSEYYDAVFAREYSGIIEASGGVDPVNGRFRIIMEYDCRCLVGHPYSIVDGVARWAKWNPAIGVTAPEGVHTDIYADVTYTWLTAWPGYQMPGASLNDMITGKRIVGVGMYNTREDYPVFGGETSTSMCQPEGTVTTHSSYGTLPDGRIMPLTVAPGNVLVSSFSSAYIASHPEQEAEVCAVTDYEGRNAYWGPEGGTSMSAPFTAGCVALFLQANPDLNSEDIIRLIRETNIRGFIEPENPRWGEGALNPRGVLEAIANNTNVESPSLSEDPLIWTCRDGVISIFNPRRKRLTVDLFDIAGTHVGSFSDGETLIEHNLAAMTTGHGLLILHISDGNTNLAVGKVLF